MIANLMLVGLLLASVTQAIVDNNGTADWNDTVVANLDWNMTATLDAIIDHYLVWNEENRTDYHYSYRFASCVDCTDCQTETTWVEIMSDQVTDVFYDSGADENCNSDTLSTNAYGTIDDLFEAMVSEIQRLSAMVDYGMASVEVESWDTDYGFPTHIIWNQSAIDAGTGGYEIYIDCVGGLQTGMDCAGFDEDNTSSDDSDADADTDDDSDSAATRVSVTAIVALSIVSAFVLA